MWPSLLLLLGACARPEPGVVIHTDHDCSVDYCDVEIVIRNFGGDTFDIEYEFSAYGSASGERSRLVGEHSGRYTIEGHRTITLQRRFDVTAQPGAFATSTGSTRRL